MCWGRWLDALAEEKPPLLAGLGVDAGKQALTRDANDIPGLWDKDKDKS
jgi:hypothetical protein